MKIESRTEFHKFDLHKFLTPIRKININYWYLLGIVHKSIDAIFGHFQTHPPPDDAILTKKLVANDKRMTLLPRPPSPSQRQLICGRSHIYIIIS